MYGTSLPTVYEMIHAKTFYHDSTQKHEHKHAGARSKMASQGRAQMGPGGVAPESHVHMYITHSVSVTYFRNGNANCGIMGV